MTPSSVDDPQPKNSTGIPETHVSRSQRDAYLGETLYHFIGNGSSAELMDIFDSIVRRGLLMTVGDKNGNLDRFSFEVVGNIPHTYEIMQKARVSFTTIAASMEGLGSAFHAELSFPGAGIQSFTSLIT